MKTKSKPAKLQQFGSQDGLEEYDPLRRASTAKEEVMSLQDRMRFASIYFRRIDFNCFTQSPCDSGADAPLTSVLEPAATFGLRCRRSPPEKIKTWSAGPFVSGRRTTRLVVVGAMKVAVVLLRGGPRVSSLCVAICIA